MNFISIGQYFYKFYSALLFVLLIPIFAFILVYIFLSANDSFASPTLLIGLTSVNAIDWIFVFIFFAKKIKSIRNRQGLGLKLEKYFYLTIVRFIVIMFGSFTLAAGLYFTKEDLFTGLFIGNLVLLTGLWPTPAKVCTDLRLRGDEREMVFFKKDKL